MAFKRRSDQFQVALLSKAMKLKRQNVDRLRRGVKITLAVKDTLEDTLIGATIDESG